MYPFEQDHVGFVLSHSNFVSLTSHLWPKTCRQHVYVIITEELQRSGL